MNRFDKFALAVSIPMTLFGLMSLPRSVQLYIVWAHLPWPMIALAGLAWILCTYGAITIAVLFWRWAKRIRYPWILHLLLFPCVYAATVASMHLMYVALRDPDFDATFGAPIMPGLLMFLIAPAGYAFALLFKLGEAATAWPRTDP